jgi:ferredoxin-NADP reductase
MNTCRASLAPAALLRTTTTRVPSTTAMAARRAHAVPSARFRSSQFAKRASRAYHIPVRAGWNDFTWSSAKVVSNAAATPEGGLRSISLDVGVDAVAAYTLAGQFIQIRTSADGKPAFIAIASAPGARAGTFELLVKSQDGTAGEICAADVGASLEVSPAMGKGFVLDGVREKSHALLFATGSGISPIKALLESGALAGREVTLYYGTQDEAHTAFLEQSNAWGCTIVRVYSEDNGRHVQDALKDDLSAIDASNAFAVLCGQKEMTTDVIDILTAAGVPKEACIMNF